MHEMEIVFPGGKRVDAIFKGFRVETDQKRPDGSPGGAIEPFDLFIASIGTCAGIYVLTFCEKRNLNTEGLKLNVRRTIDPDRHMVSELEIEIVVPADFPEKYIRAIASAAELCSVKKHLETPPTFRITTRKSGVGTQ
jgi:ribosomal protein S12 methylthiotransferase accessory factor